MDESLHGILCIQSKDCLSEDIIRKSGKEQGYLTRKSVLKPGFLILSFQEKGIIVHQVAPNKEGKYNEQSFDDAESILNEMIGPKEECGVPLGPQNGPASAPPPLNDQNDKCKA